MHFSDHDPECVPCARQHVKSGVSAMDRTLPCSSPTIWLSSCNLGDSWGGAISQRRQGSIRKRRSPFEREHSGCALQGSREMEQNAWTFRAFSPERGVDCASPDARPTGRASVLLPTPLERSTSPHVTVCSPSRITFLHFIKFLTTGFGGRGGKCFKTCFFFISSRHCTA